MGSNNDIDADMVFDGDDWERLRYRLDAAEDAASRKPDRDSSGSAAFVGQVTTLAPAVGKFLMVRPIVIFGAETEGGAGTFSVPGTPTRAVYLVGPDTAMTGDYLVCRRVQQRWVAERMTGTTVCATWQVTVHGCNSLPLAGADVLFNSIHYTTNSIGVVNIPVPSNGAWSYTISKARFANTTGSITFSGCASQTSSFNMSNATGYVCLVAYADPIPITLKYSDTLAGVSNVVITWDAGSSKWLGCATSGTVVGYSGSGHTCNASTSSMTVPLVCQFSGQGFPTNHMGAGCSYPSCDGGATFGAPANWDGPIGAAPSCGGTPAVFSNSTNHPATGGGRSVSPPLYSVPLVQTFSAVGPGGGGPADLYAGHTSTITITE